MFHMTMLCLFEEIAGRRGRREKGRDKQSSLGRQEMVEGKREGGMSNSPQINLPNGGRGKIGEGKDGLLRQISEISIVSSH